MFKQAVICLGYYKVGNGNRKVTRAGKIGLIDLAGGGQARTEQEL